MRSLSNGIAGVVGLVILLGALVATPNTAYGQNPTEDIDVAGDLDACQNLRVPAGNRFAFRLYAEGVQIYRWDGTSWIFVAPEAVLYADALGNSEVGTHYAGPTWQSVSGSRVVGSVLERCTPDPNAIPWLLLEAVSTQGPGVFGRVTFIQRVTTTGGKAPANAGSVPGEVARVPYTAVYLFYRAQH